VEGADPHGVRNVSDQGGNPFAHLSCGLVGEGNGQDSGRLYASLDESRNPHGDHPRLTRASPRKNEERTPRPFDSFSLFGIKAGEVERSSHQDLHYEGAGRQTCLGGGMSGQMSKIRGRKANSVGVM
jgi:hypothetical protein